MRFFFKTRQSARDFKTRSGNKNPVTKEQVKHDCFKWAVKIK